MDNTTIIKGMEDLIKDGQETLTAVKKATKFNQWLFSGVLAIMLVIIVDTRVDVVKKVDASEVQKEYVNKVDALNVHKLEKKYLDDAINSALTQGIDIKVEDNEWIIESILNKNYSE